MLLQLERAPHDRFGRALPPCLCRDRRDTDDRSEFDAFNRRREFAIDQRSHRRLPGTARARHQEEHAGNYRNGHGGARADGSGLLGLADRLAVLGGRLRLESPAGGGTLVAADIPLRD